MPVIPEQRANFYSTFAKQAFFYPGGCNDQIMACKQSDVSTEDGQLTCAAATNLCRSLVEEPYYNIGNRGVYDIRHPYGKYSLFSCSRR